MSLGEQIVFGYGVLSVLATAFLLLMAYWQYKKPVKKVNLKNCYTFSRFLHNQGCVWFIQLPCGGEVGPFQNYTELTTYQNEN